jgi:hypothetical protein
MAEKGMLTLEDKLYQIVKWYNQLSLSLEATLEDIHEQQYAH